MMGELNSFFWPSEHLNSANNHNVAYNICTESSATYTTSLRYLLFKHVKLGYDSYIQNHASNIKYYINVITKL
jgi:hypothetical protein